MKAEDKTVINISISNLTVAILYPIFIHWTESYKELTSKNPENYGDNQIIEKKEKKMKISNLTLYNYTGKKIILKYTNDLETEEQLKEIEKEWEILKTKMEEIQQIITKEHVKLEKSMFFKNLLEEKESNVRMYFLNH